MCDLVAQLYSLVSHEACVDPEPHCRQILAFFDWYTVTINGNTAASDPAGVGADALCIHVLLFGYTHRTACSGTALVPLHPRLLMRHGILKQSPELVLLRLEFLGQTRGQSQHTCLRDGSLYKSLDVLRAEPELLEALGLVS